HQWAPSLVRTPRPGGQPASAGAAVLWLAYSWLRAVLAGRGLVPFALMLKRIPHLFLEVLETQRRLLVIGHGWIRVPHLCQVCQPRLRQKELQNRVIPVLILEPRDTALRIVAVPKNDRPRRTGLRARRGE